MGLPAGLTIKQLLSIEAAFRTQPPEWYEKLEQTMIEFLGPGPLYSDIAVEQMIERTIIFHSGYFPEGDLRGDIVEFPLVGAGAVADNVNQNLAISASLAGAGQAWRGHGAWMDHMLSITAALTGSGSGRGDIG